jgi:hypothetical protein
MPATTSLQTGDRDMMMDEHVQCQIRKTCLDDTSGGLAYVLLQADAN